jgi:hypothetical protein
MEVNLTFVQLILNASRFIFNKKNLFIEKLSSGYALILIINKKFNL